MGVKQLGSRPVVEAEREVGGPGVFLLERRFIPSRLALLPVGIPGLVSEISSTSANTHADVLRCD